MTLVQIGYGGGRDGAGLVHTAGLTGGAHFYNCKVGGIFDNNSASSDRKWASITNMNDFWQSGTDFTVSGCYAAPVCKNIKVSDGNFVIMGNYVEGKTTIDNCFYGGNILDIVPVDGETGETTNTQGVSDKNGLDALYATGFWADGEPMMPRAALTLTAENNTLIYTEQEPVIDPETGEPVEQEPVVYTLIDGVTTDDGEIWYRVNGSDWTTEVPTSADIGKFYIEYKAVGDVFHRDSDVYAATVTLVPDWATPTGLTISSVRIDTDDNGAFVPDGVNVLRVEWDDNNVNKMLFTMEIVTPDGKKGTYFKDAPDIYEYWYELGGDRPAVRFFVGLLGENDEQIFAEDGSVNGAKYGDAVIITAKGVLDYEGIELVSVPCAGVDFMPAVSNAGKTFPVNKEGMSNDSCMENSVIVLGDKAVINCLASGGKAPYQYEVSYRKSGGARYYTARPFSTSNTVKITPAAASLYDIRITAKDSEGSTAEKVLKVEVRKVLANFSKISEETIILGESVTVEADSEGGIGEREYRIAYIADGAAEETVVQDYGANDTAAVKPDKAGAYTVKVSVRDERGAVVSKEFPLTVNKPLENVSTADAELILLGDSVTVTADSEGGLEPIEYEISVKTPDGKTALLSSYSDNTAETFRTGEVGEHKFIVSAKDARGTVVTKELDFTVHNTLTNLSEISDTEIVMGETATVTAIARGGKGAYTYSVYCKPADSDEYTALTEQSEEPQTVFTPEVEGEYNILVVVRDSLGVTADKEFTVSVNRKLSNLSALSSKNIVKGNKIIVNASAEGGKGGYEYKVSYKKSASSAYSVVQGYSDNAVIEIKPGAATDYNVRVAVRDGRGVVVTKLFTVHVYNALENNSSVRAEVIILGDTVTVHADAAGGKTPCKYEICYKKSTSESYSKAQAYSTNSEVTIKPSAAVSYDVRINAKDALGQIVSRTFRVEVCKPLENTSVISSEEISLGDSIILSAGAKDGKAPYQYEVTYKKTDSEKYTTVQAYDTNSSVSVKPVKAVKYDIRVSVKDALGQTADKDFTVRVYKPLSLDASLSADTLLLGQSVTVSAQASDGKAPYLYQVRYKKASSSNYSTASAYSENGTVTFTPAAAAAYDVQVSCKDALGTVISKDMTVNVFNTLKNTSTLSAAAVTADKSVTVRCSSTGGLGAKEYKVSYLDPDTQKWMIVKNYSAADTAIIRINKTGFFTIRTSVRDENGTVAVKDLTLNVYGVLTNTSTVSGITTKASGNTAPYNGTVTVNCSSTGAKGTPRYEVMYYSYSMKTWFTASSYSAASRVTIKTNVTGNWLVRVKVKDDRNTAVSKDFKFEVHA